MENHSLLSKKKFMACTCQVSHPFDSVHVLFVALYCVKSQETYRVKKLLFAQFCSYATGSKVVPGHWGGGGGLKIFNVYKNKGSERN